MLTDMPAAPGARHGSALQVHARVLTPASGFVDVVNAHLLLVYTGKPRLARGLLQSVLRRWAARLPELVATTESLVAPAQAAAAAMEAGRLVHVRGRQTEAVVF